MADAQVISPLSLLSVQQVTRLLGISRPLLYDLARKDGLPLTKVGGRTMVRELDLAVWLERHRLSPEQVGRG